MEQNTNGSSLANQQQQQQQGSKRPSTEVEERSSKDNKQPPSKHFKKSNTKANELRFRHGNYNRYYGYRNANQEKDQRIPALNEEWFWHKNCLDIGCNVGHLTLWIAKHFKASKVKGVDIDCELIKAARNNIVNYIDDENVDSGTTATTSQTVNTNHSSSISESVAPRETIKNNSKTEDLLGENEKSSIINNNISANNVHTEAAKRAETTTTTNNNNNNRSESPPTTKTESETIETINESKSNFTRSAEEVQFPYNVSFVTENFVPSSSNVLLYVKEEYDVIICFSVTKWIQLNSGDDGLKLMFRKVYKLLRPDGIFLLEPQPFKSYKRKKNLTPEIRRNYDNMRLFPEQYIDYLLSDEVGFRTAEQIEITKHEKEGFQRPIFVLTK